MAFAGKDCAKQVAVGKGRCSGSLRCHGRFATPPRTDTRLSAAQVDQAVSSISWFTQPERFVSIQQPSRDAKLLERAFWHHPVVDVPSTREEAVVLIESLQRETEAHGLTDGTNVVAFTGGNGPALTAYLLDSIFDGAVVGCVGDASLVSGEEREHAAYVCDLLGIDLLEVDQELWQSFSTPGLASQSSLGSHAALFSGHTADDSSQHNQQKGSKICSPLSNLSYAAVNALTRVVGLPTVYHGK